MPMAASNDSGIAKILAVKSLMVFDVFSEKSNSAAATSFLALWKLKPLRYTERLLS